jgi:hypothetical protein
MYREGLKILGCPPQMCDPLYLAACEAQAVMHLNRFTALLIASQPKITGDAVVAGCGDASSLPSVRDGFWCHSLEEIMQISPREI